MTKPALLLIGDLSHAKKEWSDFSSFAELKVRLLILTRMPPGHRRDADAVLQEFSGSSKTRADFLQELEKGSYNDVVALYRSNDSTKVSMVAKHRADEC